VITSKTQPCAAQVIRSTRGRSACPELDKPWVLAAAVLGSTMAFVDESVVNVALPTIEADLGTTLAAMQWVINAYTLCMSALLLIGGAAADSTRMAASARAHGPAAFTTVSHAISPRGLRTALTRPFARVIAVTGSFSWKRTPQSRARAT